MRDVLFLLTTSRRDLSQGCLSPPPRQDLEIALSKSFIIIISFFKKTPSNRTRPEEASVLRQTKRFCACCYGYGYGYSSGPQASGTSGTQGKSSL